MIATLSKKIAQYIYEDNPRQKQLIEVYEYGLEMLLSTLFSTLSLFALALLFDAIVEITIYMMAFGLLRILAGGYHASSHISCFIKYTVVAFGTIFIIRYLQMPLMEPLILLFGICVMSMLIVFKYAPVDTENKPFSDGEIVKYRLMSRVYIIVFSIGIVVVTYFIPLITYYSFIAAGAIFIESITLIPIINRKEKW